MGYHLKCRSKLVVLINRRAVFETVSAAHFGCNLETVARFEIFSYKITYSLRM